jgi:hypothetical protein
MKRNEFKLLIENWRNGVVLQEMHDEEEPEDINAPFTGSEDMSMMDDDLMSDEVMPSVMSGSDDERQQLLQRFCEMMGIECEESEIEDFLVGQAARAGHSPEGHSFDDMHDEEMH